MTTGIQNLDSAAYLIFEPVPLPPLSEQRAIVRYLDHVDRRIRRYIDAKRKLIDLLEEEKQAIINQAVTRGIDPNVRLKPSGVEWLGRCAGTLGDGSKCPSITRVQRIEMDYGRTPESRSLD